MYVNSLDPTSELTALGAATGTTLWTWLGAGFSGAEGSVAVVNGAVCAGSLTGSISAFRIPAPPAGQPRRTGSTRA